MDTIELGFGPEKAIAGLHELENGFKNAAETIDKSLGREANESINKFEQAAENGTKKVAKFFKDMGKKVSDDLKTAFNVTGILEGSKFVSEMGAGIRSTMEMERAFSRLQVRLGLTNKEFSQLKSSMGTRVAGTGQTLESVLPGVDTAAARGGIRSPEQISSIAESLGRAKATTGEDTNEISEAVIEILKGQGKAITGASFKATLDALQGTRTAGAFATTSEAGRAVEALAPYAKKMGLDTRQLGGMAASASRAGSSGQDILQKLLEQGTQIGGAERINAAFGSNVFKGGKLDFGAFQGVHQDRFGQYSQQVMGNVSGLTGANGADLKRFLDAMKDGAAQYKKVTSGSNETATQFLTASNNLASKLDQFREKIKNATRNAAEGISESIQGLGHASMSETWGGMKKTGGSIMDNKAVLAGGLLATVGASMLIGGGTNALLGKMPGGGLFNTLAGAGIAKAAGANPVYVVNAKEIGAASGGGINWLSGAGLAAQAAPMGLMRKMGLYGAAAAGGAAIGSTVSDAYSSFRQTGAGQVFDNATIGPLLNALASLFSHKVEMAMPVDRAAGADGVEHVQLLRQIVQHTQNTANGVRAGRGNPSMKPDALGNRGN